MSAANLQNVSIVLVHTKYPGNIGAVARCMMNTGLSDLVLVRPPRDASNEAGKLAAGAEKIVERASRFQSLKEAVAGHNLVIGASRHRSRRRKNVRTPREMAERIAPLLGTNRVAVVFGREVNGLDNDDIALCHELVAIPASDDFPSLNLSHAVMVIAYEIFVAVRPAGIAPPRAIAAAGELERLYEHLNDTLRAIGFLNRENAEHMMFSLRQLFGRAQMDPREVNILRGILTQIGRAATGKVL
jgi:TrmH family RNA methyltransferase